MGTVFKEAELMFNVQILDILYSKVLIQIIVCKMKQCKKMRIYEFLKFGFDKIRLYHNILIKENLRRVYFANYVTRKLEIEERKRKVA